MRENSVCGFRIFRRCHLQRMGQISGGNEVRDRYRHLSASVEESMGADVSLQ